MLECQAPPEMMLGCVWIEFVVGFQMKRFEIHVFQMTRLDCGFEIEAKKYTLTTRDFKSFIPMLRQMDTMNLRHGFEF